ncbi:hypothetical protein LINPERHAP1_LOCUS7574 [Linum perenne]
MQRRTWHFRHLQLQSSWQLRRSKTLLRGDYCYWFACTLCYWTLISGGRTK